jgi:hypothetical protein
MRNKSNLAGGQSAEVVIHDLEANALQIGNVAWDVERGDLALAAGEHLGAAGEAFQQHAALRRPILVAHDVLVRLELAHRNRYPGNRPPLVSGHRGDALKLSEQRVEMTVGLLDHRNAPAVTREHKHLSAVGAPEGCQRYSLCMPYKSECR